jgi:hypothetical protein
MCGAVKFTATGDPVSTVNCHCTDCRRTTGAAFGTVLYFNKEQVVVCGAVAGYTHLSDRGTEVTRSYCPNCGSQMFSSAAAWPNLFGVRAGSIEQTERIMPQRNVFVASKIESTVLDPTLPQISKMP